MLLEPIIDEEYRVLRNESPMCQNICSQPLQYCHYQVYVHFSMLVRVRRFLMVPAHQVERFCPSSPDCQSSLYTRLPLSTLTVYNLPDLATGPSSLVLYTGSLAINRGVQLKYKTLSKYREKSNLKKHANTHTTLTINA